MTKKMICRTTFQDPIDPNDIVVALARCVRVFSLTQIIDGFFDGHDRIAKRQIDNYLADGLVVCSKLLARQLPMPSSPLYVWSVGDRPPKYFSLVAKARNRWLNAETIVTKTYTLGPNAAKMFGLKSRVRLSHPLQVSHDLGLAGVYLAIWRDRLELAKQWVGEDLAKRERGQIPDAVLVGPFGRTLKAIEYCGLYSADRFKRFHQHCVSRRLPYELW